MSVAELSIEGRESPSLSSNNPFASNNPFRNRVSTASPDLPSPNPRQSRNPFLDVFDDDDLLSPDGPGTNNANAHVKASSFDSQTKPTSFAHHFGDATDLFGKMSVSEKDRRNQPRPDQSHPSGGAGIIRQGRPSDNQPRSKGPMPTNQHPNNSSSGLNTSPRGSRRPIPPGRGVSGGQRRQRSNSDTSVREASDRERERRRAERRQRERGAESGAKDDKSKAPVKGSGRRVKGSPLDVIDKLDVTGVYGGAYFHHDGPFDACNPHRNKHTKKAPMMAFPKDSKNNALTGFDPERGDKNIQKYFGNRDPEAYLDYSMPARRGSATTNDYGVPLSKEEIETRPTSKRTQSFDPIKRDPVHGDESLGLGTSTFLEGTPAAKSAIEKAATVEDRPKTSGGQLSSGNLQRKRSIVQKIRGINKPGVDGAGPIPDRRQKPTSPGELDPKIRPYPPASPPPVNRTTKIQIQTPLEKAEDEYDSAYAAKGDTIAHAGKIRDRSLSSPRGNIHPGIERAESDSRIVTASASQPESSGSLLKRVKSLSKGKRRDNT